VLLVRWFFLCERYLLTQYQSHCGPTKWPLDILIYSSFLIFLLAGMQKYLSSSFPGFNWPHSWQLAYIIDQIPLPSLLGHNFVTLTMPARHSSEVSMFLSKTAWCQNPDRYEMKGPGYKTRKCKIVFRVYLEVRSKYQSLSGVGLTEIWDSHLDQYWVVV